MLKPLAAHPLSRIERSVSLEHLLETIVQMFSLLAVAGVLLWAQGILSGNGKTLDIILYTEF